MPFESLTLQPADPLLKIIGAFRGDPRGEKIDLGVGVFRNEQGLTPVMRAVKQAEERLLQDQQSKSYLGPEGDKAFVELLAEKVFANEVPPERRNGLQTPGGTGALRLAAELLARASVEQIWMAAPSWANHAPVFLQAGVEPRPVDAFDVPTQRLDLAGFLEALGTAAPGDAVLLHGCCHNPMGIDPDPLGWRAIAEVVTSRGLLPLVDLAYQGLGDGFEEDAMGARIVLANAPFGLLAYSCDKNFGLYRERTGALWVCAPDEARSAIAQSNLLALARANWSMPPDHGAAIVRVILEDAALTRIWREELDAVRARLGTIRRALSAEGRIGAVDLTPIARGKGLFSTLPLTRNQIEWLRTEHAIYLAGSGRINVAGFDMQGIARFCDALRALDGAGVA